MINDKDNNGEKIQLISKDTSAYREMPYKYRLFNFYYRVLRNKTIGMPLLSIFIIFEMIELISYAFIEEYRKLWKINDKSFDLVQLITGATRITILTKYLTFNQYLIIYLILVGFIFISFLLIAMTLTFNRTDSKLYSFCVVFTSYVSSNCCIFFLIPISEVMLLMVKCNENDEVDIIKESIKCFEGLHFIYIFVALLMMICFLIIIVLNAIFNFNPFNANKPTCIINPSANTFLVIFKIILVILYIASNNDWINIVIMLLGSLLNSKNGIENPTYNSFYLQCLVSIRNFSVFWTFFFLVLCKLFYSSKFDGMIYFLVIGYPLIFILSSLYYRSSLREFSEGKNNFKNEDEFLMRVNFLKNLIDDFITRNSSIKNGTTNFNSLKQKEILLRGQIAIHEESCTDEECPLKKFLENQGNFQIQRTSLLHYMNILFNNAIKKFPDSQLILLAYVEFNYEKKYNLNTAKMYLEKLERFKNPLTEDYIIFFIKKSVSMIKNNFGEDEMIRIEDTPDYKFKKYKLLIDAATKIYGEFWGNLATNLTNNLNLNKLFFVGNRLNDYIYELNTLWDEFKTKRIDLEQQTILQLYAKFLKEITQNKAKAEEVDKKLKEEQNFDLRKGNQNDKIDINNLENVLENENLVFYCRSNDMGKCLIIQCSNSIVNLLGFNKQELIGKRIEMLMPLVCQQDHAKMLGKRLKKLRTLMTDGQIDNMKSRSKRQFVILPKNKAGYLIPVYAKYTIVNDDDFSNTFIIKTNMEIKDPKIMYSYYIMTRADFTIDSITSSAINLGLTMELLKKHMINLDKLILSKENSDFYNFETDYKLFIEEPQEIIWVFPDFLNKINKNAANNNEITNNNNNNVYESEIDYNYFMKKSKKKSLKLQIYPIKYKENKILGYCFQFIEFEDEFEGVKDMIGYNEYGIEEFEDKMLLYDINNLKYIRADIVKEKKKIDINVEYNDINNNLTANFNKSSLKNLTPTNDGEKNEKSHRKKEKESKKNTNNNNEENDSNNNNKKQEKKDSLSNSLISDINPLTKEVIQEFSIKNTDEIKKFIKSLPFYGKDIFMKKKTPQKQEFGAGFSVEPNINIEIDGFLKKIEQNHLLDKRQVEKEKAEKFKIEQEKNTNNDNNIVNSNLSFQNLFNANSVLIIKIGVIIYFVLLIAIIIIEFTLSFQQFNSLDDRIYYSDVAYNILTSLLYTKFLLTEAVSCQQNSSYLIIDDLYLNNCTSYTIGIMNELSDYRKSISNYIGYFSNASVGFSNEYYNFINNNDILIYSLTNDEPSEEHQDFWTGINRITTSIFYISTVTENYENIKMTDRNTYELMQNLLNDYYIKWLKLTLILSQEVENNSKNNDILLALFSISFVLNLGLGVFAYKSISKFLDDGTRPVDLIMTIKKSRFEEWKSTCETFMNKLLNKFIGDDEEMDEDNNEEANLFHSSEEDIVISKFKQKNVYNQSIKSNKDYLSIFIGILISITIFQGYFIFKYFYCDINLKKIKNFSSIHNITRYSEHDIILNYNIIKSYFFDKNILILNENFDEKSFENFLSNNISNSFEEFIRITYNQMEYLNLNYINSFFNLLNDNITYLNTGNFNDDEFLETMINGMNSLILRYNSLIFVNSLYNIKELINYDYNKNMEYAEASLMIRYIIRPWYVEVHNNLDKYFKDYHNNINIVETTTFIIFLLFAIILYSLVWKNIEYQMENYLKSAIELINLIPEEMKLQILLKLNEEEQRENKF